MKGCRVSLFPALAGGLFLALVGCGGGSGGGSGPGGPPPTAEPPQVDSCGIEAQKTFVADLTREWYLWYDELADVDPAAYTDVNDYLLALTEPLAGDGRDPGFSYVTTRQADEANFSRGAFVGFGFRYGLDAQNRFYFSDVFQGGPAGDAGLRRGDEVLAIDTGAGFETIAELAARNVTTDELFGAREAGVERGFRIRRDEAEFEVSLVKRELDTPPFAEEPTLLAREGLAPVGYLNLRGFTLSAEEPLNQAMTVFGEAGVTDIVVDLRYNGGGLLDIAQQLLDLLGGLAAEGEDSYRINHNDKQQAENVSGRFAVAEASIEPLRMVFITSGGTASASEMVINGLAPHVELVLVGADTYGKAVGQYAFDQIGCDTRVRLVSFEILNGEGQGGYYTGLVDTGRFTLCPATDDISRPFGDPEEASLRTALDWLSAGVCGQVAASSRGGLRDLAPSPWALATQPEGPFGRSPWVQ